MNIDFKNKNIIVTGGNSNLGKKIVDLLIKDNAIVHATTTNKKIANDLNKKNQKKIYIIMNQILIKTRQLKNFLKI